MAWTAHNKLYLTGTITSGLTLSPSNADGGSATADMALTTYDDATYDDGNYQITAIYEGAFTSSFTSSKLTWVSVGGASDIKYQLNESSDGVTYNGWGSTHDAIGTTYVNLSKQYIKIRFIFYSSNWSDSDSIYVSSNTRRYVEFTKGAIIDADDMNNNFYIAGQDHLLPRGGTILDPTTGLYDLGSSSKRWAEAHINNIYLSSTVANTWYHLTHVAISAAATTRFEISGLGVYDENIYRVFLNGIMSTNTSNNILLFLNGDSGTNYGYNILFFGIGAASTSFTTTMMYLATETSGIFVGKGHGTNTTYYNTCDFYIEATTGKRHCMIGTGRSGMGNTMTTFGDGFHVGGVWENDSDTLTSIVFYVADKFDAGTEVDIWVKA